MKFLWHFYVIFIIFSRHHWYSLRTWWELVKWGHRKVTLGYFCEFLCHFDAFLVTTNENQWKSVTGFNLCVIIHIISMIENVENFSDENNHSSKNGYFWWKTIKMTTKYSFKKLLDFRGKPSLTTFLPRPTRMVQPRELSRI